MLFQVADAFFQRFQVFGAKLVFRNAAVVFQGTYGSDEDDGIWF